MSDRLINALIDRWMSEKEAKIYLTVMELGSVPASTISRRSWVKRVTTYGILKDMITSGIARSMEKNGMIYFHVVDPEKLLLQLQQKFHTFAEVLPELREYTDTYNNKPKIQYYEWLDWLKQLYDHILDDADDEIIWLIGTEWIDPRLEHYLYENNVPRRVKLWIKAKIIVSDTPGNRLYAWIDMEWLKETKVSSGKILQTASEINLYGKSKIAQIMYHHDDLFGIVIESPSLYANWMSIFDFIWSQF